MQGLIDLDFDVEALGFSTNEIDLTIDGEQSASSKVYSILDAIEPVGSGPAVMRAGDLWRLGRTVFCVGDTRSQEDVAHLCNGKLATLLFNTGLAQTRDGLSTSRRIRWQTGTRIVSARMREPNSGLIVD